MATRPVPTLSTKGWVGDFTEKVDFLLAHFFLCDYNQTYFYPDNVTSLVRIIEKRGSFIEGAVSDINDLLSKYLRRYFDNVTVSSTITAKDEEWVLKDAIIKLVVEIDEPAGVRTLAQTFQSLDGVFKRVVDRNNND